MADGVVAETKDGIRGNVPGKTRAQVSVATVAGNHVVLDLGGVHSALCAHLQPGSLRVKTGDRVQRGQVLGLVGNTGNSYGPHLHFHISDGIPVLGSEGLPYTIDSYEVLSVKVWEPREAELPMNDDRVRFP
jgi:murein DD-endopeptidase MepM/ murein hydrolase activator NlpD